VTSLYRQLKFSFALFAYFSRYQSLTGAAAPAATNTAVSGRPTPGKSHPSLSDPITVVVALPQPVRRALQKMISSNIRQYFSVLHLH